MNSEKYIERSTHAMDIDPATGKPMPKTATTLTGSYKGYSNEPKPVIDNPVEGVIYSFLELDTKSIYILHNDEWVLFL